MKYLIFLRAENSVLYKDRWNSLFLVLMKYFISGQVVDNYEICNQFLARESVIHLELQYLSISLPKQEV